MCGGVPCGVKAPLSFFPSFSSNADWRKYKCSEGQGSSEGPARKPEIKSGESAGKW